MNQRCVLGVGAALWLIVSAAGIPQAAGQRGGGASAAAEAAAGIAAAAAAAAATASGSVADATPRALLERYCISCHNGRLKTGGLALDTADIGNAGAEPDRWEKVVRKLRAGMMPPPGMPVPSDSERRSLVTSLERVLDRAALSAPRPGHPLVHR
jgi:mono/diheme cytochrome c family protein